MLQRSVGAVAAVPFRLVVRAHRRRLSRQSGFALLAVMTAAALLGAIVGEFGYNARVELEAAANARDTLRAEYAARSGVNLARLLIKVQQGFIDPAFNNAKINADIQIMDFAPFLLGAFGGGDDERKAFGDLLGFDAASLKGLGLGRGVSIDPVLSAEDGKININCGGNRPVLLQAAQNAQAQARGDKPQAPNMGTPATALYYLLVKLFEPPRYRRFFENASPDGQFYTADEFARAILDWSDADEQRFEPLASVSGSGSGAAEDYRYDTLRDPYKAHNHYFDTVEELNLVRGVGDDFFGSFASMFTVYGSCHVHLRAVGQKNWPITTAIIRASVNNPQDPMLADDNVISALAQNVAAVLQLPGLVSNVDSWAQAVAGGGIPQALAQQLGAAGGMLSGANMTGLLPFANLTGPPLNIPAVRQLARIGMNSNPPVPPSSREVYRIQSTGAVKRAGDKKIQVRIVAIFDTQHFNQNTTSVDLNDKFGTWVYWRME